MSLITLRPDGEVWEDVLATLGEHGEPTLFTSDEHGHFLIQFVNHQECNYVHDLQEVRITKGLDEVSRMYGIYHELIHREQWHSQDPGIISLVRDWKKPLTLSDEHYDSPLEMMAYAGALSETEFRFGKQVPAGSPLRRYGQRVDKRRDELINLYLREYRRLYG